MTAAADPHLPRGFGATSRPDRWWLKPLATLTGLTSFIVYSSWAAFQGEHYAWGPYLSPFYSPLIFSPDATHTTHAWFGARPAWYPWSPALLILWAPGGFRLTCYYYRGAYYKAFWADPPSCAVGEPRKSYLGEASFPLILQNVHRYFLYLAVVFLFILGYDVWKAIWFESAVRGGVELGVGVGTLVLAINVVLLSGYALGCHSMRHLAGGLLDTLSGAPVRRRIYRGVSCLNRGHMPWAWVSLVWVAFSDLYVRLCSMGVWTDWRIL